MRTEPSTSAHRRIGAAVLVAATVLAVLITGARPASACSCTAPAPPETAATEADAVFVGEVVDVDERAGTTHTARLVVTEVFTGEVGQEVEVDTPSDSAACGYGFEVGRDELVYAVLDDQGRLQTNLCDRTAPVADADEDLTALGPGEDPQPGATDDAGPSAGVADGVPWPVVAAAVLALLAAAAAVALRRRSPPSGTR